MNIKTLATAAVIAMAPAVASALNFAVEITESINPSNFSSDLFMGVTGTGFYEFTPPGDPYEEIFLSDSEFSLTLDFATGPETFVSSQDLFGSAVLLLDDMGNEDNLFFDVEDDDSFFGLFSDQIATPDIIELGIVNVVLGSTGRIEKVELGLTVVPVPAALPMMLAGLGVFAAAARRKS